MSDTEAASLPAAIFIIRHGEKPTGKIVGVDLEGKEDADSLIPQGWQRAGGLATLFNPSDGVFPNPLLSQPTLIAVPSYGTPDKHRTYQTAWPLGLKLGLSLQADFEVGKEAHLVDWLLQQPGQTILVCWEHDHIEDITNCLAPLISGGDVPGPWPSDRFDLVVAFTPAPGTPSSYLCTQIPQLLLAGDSAQPIPPAPTLG